MCSLCHSFVNVKNTDGLLGGRKTPVLWTESEFFDFAKRLHARPCLEVVPASNSIDNKRHEPFSEIITCHIALSASHCMVAKELVSHFGGSSSSGSQNFFYRF